MNLPAEDDHERFGHLLAVARCGKRARAISTRRSTPLASAFKLDPDYEDARAALERLAESNGAWDQLVAVLDETDRGVGQRRARGAAAHRFGARAREAGRMTDAEARYHRALGMRPDDEAAMSRLEAVYRQSERWGELATLLERRLHGLIERMPPVGGARLRALELADVYEKIGNTYEAIDAWTHVARRVPRSRAGVRQPGAPVRVGRPVVQGDRVADARARRPRFARARAGEQQRARELSRRIGEHLREGAGAARARHRGVRRGATTPIPPTTRRRRRSSGSTRSWGAGSDLAALLGHEERARRARGARGAARAAGASS